MFATAWVKEKGILDPKTKELIIEFAKKIEEMMEIKDEKN